MGIGSYRLALGAHCPTAVVVDRAIEGVQVGEVLPPAVLQFQRGHAEKRSIRANLPGQVGVRNCLTNADHRGRAANVRHLHRVADVVRRPKWRCRLQDHHPFRQAIAVLLQPVKHVQRDRYCRTIVLCECGRAQERDIRAGIPGHVRNLCVVGGDNHAAELGRSQRRFN